MRVTTQAASYGFAALLALAGCGSNAKGSRLSLSAKASAETAAPAGAATGLAVGDHVVLERVRVVIRDVKLESHAAGTTTTTTTTKPHGSGDGLETETETEHEGEIEVRAGPVLLDLGADALTGAKLQEAVSAVIPDGTYDELKLKIHPLEDGETTGDADVDAARASVVLDGTFDGAPFRFVSRLSTQQKLEGAFTVSGGAAANITLSIDLSGWFTGPAGEALDPSSAAAKQLIEGNIRASLHAFEDDDRNGHDDGVEHRGGADDGAGHT